MCKYPDKTRIPVCRVIWPKFLEISDPTPNALTMVTNTEFTFGPRTCRLCLLALAASDRTVFLCFPWCFRKKRLSVCSC